MPTLKSLQLLRFLDCFVDGANHVESLLGQIVVLTVQDFLEATDGFFQRNVLTGAAGEDFSNVEGLRQEAFDFTRALYDQLVFLGQFVHTQNRDDVFQLFVALQNRLYTAGYFVVLGANDQRVELA